MKLWRSIKWLFFISAALLFLLLLLGWLYKDAIQQQLLQWLNRYTKGEIRIRAIEVSFIQCFPSIAITLYEPRLKLHQQHQEKYQIPQSKILHSEKIHIIIDLWQYLRYKRLVIKKLLFENTLLYLYHTPKTLNLLLPFEPLQHSSSESSDSIDLAFETISWEGLRLHYIHTLSGNHFYLQAQTLQLKGALTHTQGQWQLTYKGTLYYKRQQYQWHLPPFSLLLQVHFTPNYWKIPIVQLQIGKMTLNGTGKKEKDFITMNIHANNLPLQMLIQQVAFLKHWEKFRIKGLIHTQLHIDGKWNTHQLPRIKGNLRIENGTIFIPNLQNTITALQSKLSIDCPLSRLEQAKITLSNLRFRLQQHFFTFQGKIKNFKNPYFSFSFQTALPTTLIGSLFSLPLKQGSIQVDLRGEGGWQAILQQQWHKVYLQGKVDLQLKQWEQLRQLQLRMQFHNRTAEIQYLEGFWNHSHFRIQGTLNNLLKALTKKAPLEIQAKLYSRLWDLNDFSYESDTSTIISFPVICVLQAQIDTLRWDKQQLLHTKGTLYFQNNRWIIRDLKTHAFQGTLAIPYLEQNKNQWIGITKAQEVDLKTLFAHFPDLSDMLVVGPYAQGTLNADCHFTIPQQWEKMKMEGSIQLQNFVLKDFEPLYKISKLIEIKSLKIARFSPITTTFKIQQQWFFLDTTTFFVNQYFVQVYGKHHIINGTLDYHWTIAIPLRAQGDSSIASLIEEVQTQHYITFFIHIHGSVETPRFTIDKKAIKRRLKAVLKQQPSSIKEAFEESTQELLGEQDTTEVQDWIIEEPTQTPWKGLFKKKKR